jgi:hypothetical protein
MRAIVSMRAAAVVGALALVVLAPACGSDGAPLALEEPQQAGDGGLTGPPRCPNCSDWQRQNPGKTYCDYLEFCGARLKWCPNSRPRGADGEEWPGQCPPVLASSVTAADRVMPPVQPAPEPIEKHHDYGHRINYARQEMLDAARKTMGWINIGCLVATFCPVIPGVNAMGLLAMVTTSIADHQIGDAVENFCSCEDDWAVYGQQLKGTGTQMLGTQTQAISCWAQGTQGQKVCSSTNVYIGCIPNDPTGRGVDHNGCCYNPDKTLVNNLIDHRPGRGGAQGTRFYHARGNLSNTPVLKTKHWCRARRERCRQTWRLTCNDDSRILVGTRDGFYQCIVRDEQRWLDIACTAYCNDGRNCLNAINNTLGCGWQESRLDCFTTDGCYTGPFPNEEEWNYTP